MNDALPHWYDGSVLAINDYVVAGGFPTAEQLRRGCLPACIANAVYIAAQGGHAEHAWEDGSFPYGTYVEDTEQGKRWAAFSDRGCVAVFYSSESDRNPFPKGRPRYDQARYFRGMPEHLARTKEQALGHMINLNRGSETDFKAAITTTMWADGERFTAAEPWAGVYNHALWACNQQVLPVPVALAEWRWNFESSDEQLALVHALYERRLAAVDGPMMMSTTEEAAFMAAATEAQWDVAVGDPATWIDEARNALSRVGILLP